MNNHVLLADRFEAQRTHLRGVAYRMLGSLGDADDAVQETWLRLSRSDISEVENFGAWLTTVAARICLDMLRSRKARREEQLEAATTDVPTSPDAGADPEYEALLADSIGLALLVVLDTLTPAERVAFVLHDIFGIALSEIAPIIGRSAVATRQLASRARRRVSGTPAVPVADLVRQREVVDAFLAASRGGSFEALIGLLDPDVVLQGDEAASALEANSQDLRGAPAVANFFMGRATIARSALVNGAVGVMIAPHGHLRLVLEVTLRDGKISQISVVADPARLSAYEFGVLPS